MLVDVLIWESLFNLSVLQFANLCFGDNTLIELLGINDIIHIKYLQQFLVQVSHAQNINHYFLILL